MANLTCLEHTKKTADASQSRADAAPSVSIKNAADVRLAADVADVLQNTGHRQVCRVRVTVSNGVVVLRGVVSRYYVKQLAQAAVLRLKAVEVLRNEIAVIQ